MLNWLDLSKNANLLRNAYIKGILDISGGDLIVRNGNAYIAKDVSLNGNLYVGQNLLVNGLPLSSLLSVFNNDISLNQRLFAGGDTIIGEQLFVRGDTSLNGNLYIGKNLLVGGLPLSSLLSVFTNDISLNKRIFIGGDSSLNGNLFVGKKTFQQGDSTLNQRLFVGGDASFNGNLYVSNILTCNELIINGTDNSTNGFTFSDLITASGGIIANSDITANTRMFVNRDATFNGNSTCNQTLQLTRVLEFLNASGGFNSTSGAEILNINLQNAGNCTTYLLTSSSITKNFTINLLNFPSVIDSSITLTLIIPNGNGFASSVTGITTAPTIRFNGGIPTITSTNIVQSLSIIYTNSSNYYAYSSVSSFS